MLSVLLATTAVLAEPDEPASAPTTAPSDRQVFNTDPDFILHLPRDFKDCASVKPPANMLYFWAQHDGADHKTNVYVEIDKVQELPQVPFEKPDNVEKMYAQKWKGWDIDVFVIRSTIKDEHGKEQEMVTRNAAVPIKGNALKLQVTGPAASDSQMEALLTDLLAGLEGQTNWTTPENHTLRTVLCGAGLVVALAAVGVVLLLRQRQWTKRREHSAVATMHMPK
jgi:hypothetical protein